MASKRVINLDEASAPASNMSMLVDDPTYGARKLPLSKMLAADGDSKSNTVQYSTGDADDSEVTKDTGWTPVTKLTSGITHATLFNRISTMMKNVRYLWKLIGTASDISSLSTAGTVSGALTKLNTDLTTLIKRYPTYVQNAYCTETEVARVYIIRYGNIGLLVLNLGISTPIPSGAINITIGTFANVPQFANTVSICVTGQTVPNSSILVDLAWSGDNKQLNITNQSGTAASGWYRTIVPILFS